MIKKIIFWLDVSRLFTTPMTIMSWLVVFTLAILSGGNAKYGVIALVGIIFAHLATNLLDDFLDYKKLVDEKKDIQQNTQKSKCKYILDGKVSMQQVFGVVLTYLDIAAICGLYLIYKTGLPVIIFMGLGAIATLFYSKFSHLNLGEFAVLFTFGPVLYGGVYYVMTQSISLDVILFSFITAFMTLGLLITHTLLDFDYDMKESKHTVCTTLKTKKMAMAFWIFVISMAYITVGIYVLAGLATPWLLLTLLTIPYAIRLYYSVRLYNDDKNAVPDKKWFDFPMENIEKYKECDSYSFTYRLYQARNLMIYFSILLTLGIIL